MNGIPCIHHPGRIVRPGHPCRAVVDRRTKEVCGWAPQAVPETCKPKRQNKPKTSQEQEASVETTETLESEVREKPGLEHVTLSTGDGEVIFDGSAEEFEDLVDNMGDEPKRPDYGVIDRNTGEVVQLSLLGAQWDQYKVETLRLSLSGGDEFIKSMFDELVDGELSPGAIVEVVARGIVKEHAPVFKKDGHEGKTVILLEVVRRITVLGHMTGKVEAAQNVDGEAKVLEDVDPEVALQEADDLRDQEDATDGE